MPATSASASSYSTPATATYSAPATATPDAARHLDVAAFHLALAVTLGVVGLALCTIVGIFVARETRRRRLRHASKTRSTPGAPVEGVKTPADAWASMATFEAALSQHADRDEKADSLYADGKAGTPCAAADEKTAPPKAGKRSSAAPHIQIQVTTSSSWVIEQDLTELWTAARRDASAPQRESVPFDLGDLKGRA